MTWLDNINNTFGKKREKVIAGIIVLSILTMITVGTALYLTATQ